MAAPAMPPTTSQFIPFNTEEKRSSAGCSPRNNTSAIYTVIITPIKPKLACSSNSLALTRLLSLLLCSTDSSTSQHTGCNFKVNNILFFFYTVILCFCIRFEKWKVMLILVVFSVELMNFFFSSVQSRKNNTSTHSIFRLI